MPRGCRPHADGDWQKWHLALGTMPSRAIVAVAVLSMGNPHAVQEVADVDDAPVRDAGPADRAPSALSEAA